ncbi:BRO-N domain-containing protein [Klebsiella quasipneumoniae]|uniref:BRO-N domain-containing protein n=1 Tax=Klebsiella quasipneumoniae TaxID=1463165 RepID=UPI00296E2855|nr:Bro-N domain-containing protein [Klebsiella quasipneumoniae]
MNNKMQLFKFENQRVRTLTVNGEPYFVGKDIAEILGYSRTADAIKAHVDDEDKLTRQFTDSGQHRSMTVINESGLYSLILSSKLPNAKKFKRWVTSEGPSSNSENRVVSSATNT